MKKSNNKKRLEKIKNDINNKYYVSLRCADCNSELNRTKEMTGKELYDAWTNLIISSGFNAGKCKKGCRSTFNDLNINTEFKIRKTRNNKRTNRSIQTRV